MKVTEGVKGKWRVWRRQEAAAGSEQRVAAWAGDEWGSVGSQEKPDLRRP